MSFISWQYFIFLPIIIISYWLLPARRRLLLLLAGSYFFYGSWRRARRGKRDRLAVADFELNLESELLTLQTELQTMTYQPGAYHNFYIFEPKRRLVSAAPFRDRVAQESLRR